MTYGDGDGKLFTGFTGAIDVIAHELTHGVTQFTVPGGGLVYEDQSGALNESISDVFGTIVKQWQLKQDPKQADWLIGAGIMTPAVGKALRSMADPGNTALTWSGDDQPGHMSKYVEGGDVHTNSGIPNHAFYFAAQNLKANTWEKAGPIWYKALSLLNPNATFAEAAQATVQAAELLYGVGSSEAQAVQAAWREVGVS
jgi:Zn-dependent metalloprotease